MGSEFIERNIDRFAIHFEDGYHDALTTTGQGLISGIREIVFGNDPTSYSDGTLYVHIDGDPTKFQVSEDSFESTFVKTIAFSDLTSGVQRIDSEPQPGEGETVAVVLMDADTPDSTLARAGVTATEGITAAVQDLMVTYGGIRASGSRKQNVIVVRNRGSIVFLRDAGKHSRLGELIGKTVIGAVKASADANGVNPGARKSVVSILSSYGYSQDELQRMSGCPDSSAFLVKVITKDSESKALLSVSAAFHVYDYVRWGLFPEEEGKRAVQEILRAGLREPVGFGSIPDIIANTVAFYFTDP